MPQPGVGSRVGPYLLTGLLGRGGFGEVYEAEDTEKGRLVALKLMSSAVSADPVFRRRMYREASTAGRLNEPHVVPIHSYGEIDDRLYIDMRLIRGIDLAAVLKRDGPLEPARAVWIVRQIASALDAAHAADLVHRDVKPANILLADGDFACLADFGLAHAASDTRLTSAGTMIGTLAYLAPERFIDSEAADHRADVYALACVLFECLTGSQPYPAAGNAPEVIRAHLEAPIPKPSRFRSDLAVFDEVITRGLAKDPTARYVSAGELARAAQHAVGGAVLPPPPSSPVTAPTAEWPSEPVRPATTATMPLLPADARPTHIIDPGATEIAPTLQAAVPVSGRRRRGWVIPVLVAAVVIAVAAGAGVLFLGPGRRSAAPAVQTELPFTGLDHPQGIAVGADGAVYVADRGNRRIVKLSKDAAAQEVLPFADLGRPWGVAVDQAGTVYVTDLSKHEVYKQTPGFTGQAKLPFTFSFAPRGIAVTATGDVYIAGGDTEFLVNKLGQSSLLSEKVDVTGLVFPTGLAVDSRGNMYVADGGNNRVVKLPADSGPQLDLPFAGLSHPWGVAVDGAGNVYVADGGNNRVVKLPAATGQQVELPFEGLTSPRGVAVDGAGTVYITDQDTGRVLQLRG